jgi:hypothetical protein
LEEAGGPAQLESGEDDSGLLKFDDGEEEAATTAFIAALSRQRHFDRESDRPQVWVPDGLRRLRQRQEGRQRA